MAVIGKEEALRIATAHVARVPAHHPDYRLECELSGFIEGEWLFAYRTRCLKDIPEEEQERFAGAGGFFVSAQGEVRDLSVPMFIEAERKLGAG